MKYYESHEDAYRKIKKNNISSWDEFRKQSESFENFCMKEYLVTTLDKIKPISNARVLEIGCGTGPISCYLAQQGYNVDGIDISQTAIEIAQTNAKDRGLNIHYYVDDICSISKTRSDIYDIIIDGHCMHCITYDTDRHAALTNIFRLLKKSGYFVIETMSMEDSSQWPHSGRIDEQGIVWCEVKENYPYEKVKFEDKYWICTRRIMCSSDLENELKQTGFLVEHIEIKKEEKHEYMADFRAICRKPMSD
ncbi:methyltransferase domain-containing protein [candidate division WOR-3 bacterium]|nr:methyltransferase domain-containing protein [candidate division WOR-3 bacterium]